MNEGTFWDNPDAAQKTIQKVKVLNVLLKPYEELAKAADDLNAMVELAADDSSFEAELEGELVKALSKYEAF